MLQLPPSSAHCTFGARSLWGEGGGPWRRRDKISGEAFPFGFKTAGSVSLQLKATLMGISPQAWRARSLAASDALSGRGALAALNSSRQP